MSNDITPIHTKNITPSFDREHQSQIYKRSMSQSSLGAAVAALAEQEIDNEDLSEGALSTLEHIAALGHRIEEDSKALSVLINELNPSA